MFEIEKEVTFSASHKLYKGGRPGEQDHFHLWKIQTSIRSKTLNEFGFVIDYDILEKYLKEIVFPLHKKSLNSFPPFDKTNPTAEWLAWYIFCELQDKVYNDKTISNNVIINYVKIFKDEDVATYYPSL